MTHQIPPSWETDNLLIHDTEQFEIADLQAIYNNLDYVSAWTGDEGGNVHYIQEEFDKKHLPKDGKGEFHRLQSIKLKSENKVIGYTVLYHGFPDSETLWIAILAMHTDYQRKHFGREIVVRLVEEGKKMKSYKHLSLAVGTKNWPALRFWINTGFTTIIKLDGDKIHNDKTFTELWLTQELKK